MEDQETGNGRGHFGELLGEWVGKHLGEWAGELLREYLGEHLGKCLGECIFQDNVTPILKFHWKR